MENQNTNRQFKEDEIAYIRRWDKELNDYISNPYPKIGGRLRLAHEDNEVLSIETEIVRYDEQIVKQAYYLEQGATMFHVINAFTRGGKDRSLSASGAYRLERTGGQIFNLVR